MLHQRHGRGFSVLLKGLPGAPLGDHHHVGTVRGYTLRGHWRYLEHHWIARPGTFIYEPAGEAHTLVVTDDSPEPAVILFMTVHFCGRSFVDVLEFLQVLHQGVEEADRLSVFVHPNTLVHTMKALELLHRFEL